jgi:hypothetical protein
MIIGNGRTHRWLFGLGLLPLLMGCTYTRGEPSATADSVLAAQYRATGAHGPLTGTEAQQITDSYQQQIGAASAPPRADMADTAATGDAQSAPAASSAFGR